MSKISFGPLSNSLNNLSGTSLIYIIDENIFKIYNDSFKTLKNIWVAPAGEDLKKLTQVEKCIEYFLEKGVDRNYHLVVIGGGATSDFGGFVASILLRGISFSVIPTTLLSMVDSSIGGKTGVNSKSGKNLIGSFHLPENVFIDINFLETLAQGEMKSGMGEILKYCFLNEATYDVVLNERPLKEIIKTCIDYKNLIVKNDFKESGDRKFLNLGHSIGHALELHHNLSHGEAVRLGLYLILAIYGTKDLKNKFDNLNNRFMGKLEVPKIDVEKLMPYILKDKKKINESSIDLVCIEEIGRPYLRVTSFNELRDKLEWISNQSQ